jgi:hypothetical protein
MDIFSLLHSVQCMFEKSKLQGSLLLRIKPKQIYHIFFLNKEDVSDHTILYGFIIVHLGKTVNTLLIPDCLFIHSVAYTLLNRNSSHYDKLIYS